MGEGDHRVAVANARDSSPGQVIVLLIIKQQKIEQNPPLESYFCSLHDQQLPLQEPSQWQTNLNCVQSCSFYALDCPRKYTGQSGLTCSHALSMAVTTASGRGPCPTAARFSSCVVCVQSENGTANEVHEVLLSVRGGGFLRFRALGGVTHLLLFSCCRCSFR